MSALRTLAYGLERRAVGHNLHQLSSSLGSRAAWIHVEKRLNELGIELPTAPKPKANYNIVCHASGNMLYVSGHLPVLKDGTMMTGRIGPQDQTVEHGKQAARQAGLNIISTLKEQLGDLDRVKQVVKVCNIMFVTKHGILCNRSSFSFQANTNTRQIYCLLRTRSSALFNRLTTLNSSTW